MRLVFTFTSLAALTLFAQPVQADTLSASASTRNDSVTRFCLAGFQAAFQAARKVPPDGMGAYTCNCFVEQVNKGSSIQGATDICRQLATTKYRL
ncbi:MULTISPECIES: hypothetical protein [unclassified Synechococcus]|jgi:hypothetical protein|uniref:hypothetical protein n=1 Tax=unclassified Synechococcus TaxID=2626047 RepID=UPI000B98D3F1|nr:MULTISPECIES: hypothetical protein [unclassified Synechococcus]MCP9827390.1 hypothetical protein [Synechococcus sp. L2F]MCP9845597.1 hypothetical protein [Synechococcus sp. Lug-A]